MFYFRFKATITRDFVYMCVCVCVFLIFYLLCYKSERNHSGRVYVAQRAREVDGKRGVAIAVARRGRRAGRN
ncbi:hypothetical protein PUN28_001931 [Cardiocondyla obscurior]|uniref:Uncharacterized protein n=1 Tax=Cardiocondyla obscurior TaxID=286306 RepID=A0AAW2GRR5_9HYME